MNFAQAEQLSDDELLAAIREANKLTWAAMSDDERKAMLDKDNPTFPEPPTWYPTPPGGCSHCSDVTLHVADAFERYYGPR